MRRSSTAPLRASEWPDWVLGFHRGTHPDPKIQAEIIAEFHRWRAAKAEWREQHCPNMNGKLFLDVANAEARRRAGIRKRPTGDPTLAGPRPPVNPLVRPK